uniref:Uncharacterized protein n=1 Tax=Oryza rufipogon TaxID=4529 RepID=A0A0E0N4B1_ORYRU
MAGTSLEEGVAATSLNDGVAARQIQWRRLVRARRKDGCGRSFVAATMVVAALPSSPGRQRGSGATEWPASFGLSGSGAVWPASSDGRDENELDGCGQRRRARRLAGGRLLAWEGGRCHSLHDAEAASSPSFIRPLFRQEPVAIFGHSNLILVGLEVDVACALLLCRRGMARENDTSVNGLTASPSPSAFGTWPS